MRRGLTMLELLLALALMAAVLTALLAVIQTTAAATVTIAEPLQWRTAAERVVQLVRADLLCGDFSASADRVSVTDGTLRIRTRASGADAVAGPVTCLYALRGDGRLELERRAPGGSIERRDLLGGVRRFACAVGADGRVLAVTIASEDGLELEWELRVR